MEASCSAISTAVQSAIITTAFPSNKESIFFQTREPLENTLPISPRWILSVLSIRKAIRKGLNKRLRKQGGARRFVQARASSMALLLPLRSSIFLSWEDRWDLLWEKN